MLTLTAALFASALAAATPLPDTPDAARSVQIVNQSGRWASLFAGNDLNGADETMFVISGEVENRGPTTVHWVKIEYRLIADTAAGETLVSSEYGYNLRAEALRGPPAEPGSAAALQAVQPIAPGEKDLFRMVFFRADVGHFDRWRVSILEVR